MPLLPQSSEQQKQLLAGVVALMLLLIYYQFVHTKRGANVDALAARLEALETTNAAARALAARDGSQLEHKLATLEQHIARLEELIPQREEVPDLLHAMTLRAEEAGVELIRMSPRLEEPGPYYSKQTYDVAVKGTAHRVGRYLTEVGSLPRIVTAAQLTLLSSAGETDRNGTPMLDASFRIITYIVPDAASPREPPEPQAHSPRRAAARPAALVADARQSEPNQSEPKQSEPKQSEPKQSEPNRSDPSRSEPKLIYEREVFVYPVDNRRDPFEPLGSAGTGPMFEELSLRMIIWSVAPDQSIAVLGDRSQRSHRLRTGERLGNARLVEITPARAVFVVEDYGNRRRQVLDLRPNPGTEGAGR